MSKKFWLFFLLPMFLCGADFGSPVPTPVVKDARPTLVVVSSRPDYPCLACRVFEKSVMEDPAVEAELGGYKVIWADGFDPRNKWYLDSVGGKVPGVLILKGDFLDKVIPYTTDPKEFLRSLRSSPKVSVEDCRT